MFGSPVKKGIVAFALTILLLFVLGPVAAVDSGALVPGGWERLVSGGLDYRANTSVGAMARYAGRIFLGTNNSSGCRVWSYDGLAWNPEIGADEPGTPTGPGFGLTSNTNVSAMAVFDSRLYVTVRNAVQGCSIWSYNGSNWTQVVGQGAPGTPTGPGFGEAGNVDVPAMAVFGGRLYAGTYNEAGCQVWRHDGQTWSRVASGGFGDPRNYGVSSMAVYNGRLYVGTYSNDYSSGCQVWSYDGHSWIQVVGQGAPGTPTGPGFGETYNRKASSMTVYDAGLYVGTYDSSGSKGCEIWSYDGANWTRVAAAGIGDAGNLGAVSMVAGGVDLYVGTFNDDSGCQVWRFDGTDWVREAAGGFGYPGNVSATSLLLDGEKVLAGTQNQEGLEVWSLRALQVLYFAEGYTGEGFDEYLCLGNPHAVPVRTAVTYLFPDGTALSRKVLVPAESRMTIHVNIDVGTGREVSVKLESDGDIAAERPMYFTYGGKWPGGHITMGTGEASTTWYFAEGYTGEGFEEWICVLNPLENEATISFYFQTQESGVVDRTGFKVPAGSRRSFFINDILGPGYQHSLKLISDSPVVVERLMYFDYLGTGRHHWQGGHCVKGATSLSQTYYFAEGTTHPGFEEWLTIQNPNPFNILVYASFQPGPEQGAVVERSYIVRAGKRYTIYVPGEVGRDKDVSVLLVSTAGFLAERPMYFDYAGWKGGDCVMGSTRAGEDWFLAEGYTGPGFHTWLCLQNPGSEDAVVVVSYLTQEAGALPSRLFVVPPRTRHTVFVNHDAGEGYQLSMRIRSDSPIVVERPMYFDSGRFQGGHTLPGQ
ncbi:MAG: hypothetical protein H5T72_00125 [Actinobacteria bacterium]|nr:hypothetical protein [Actinomycetota bacterium]